MKQVEFVIRILLEIANEGYSKAVYLSSAPKTRYFGYHLSRARTLWPHAKNEDQRDGTLEAGEFMSSSEGVAGPFEPQEKYKDWTGSDED